MRNPTPTTLLVAVRLPSVAVAWLLITWAPTILLEASGVDLAGAAVLASGVGFAAVPALVGAGVASDACARRGLGRKALVAGGHLFLALTLLVLAAGVEGRWGATLIAGLLLLVSFAQWSPWAPAYALLADLTPRAALGMAFGLGATVWSLGALTAPWVAGATRDATGSFTMVYYVLAALSAAGAVLAAAIRPSFRLGKEPPLEAQPPAGG
jgi:sugar phosphate permease